MLVISVIAADTPLKFQYQSFMIYVLNCSSSGYKVSLGSFIEKEEGRRVDIE